MRHRAVRRLVLGAGLAMLACAIVLLVRAGTASRIGRAHVSRLSPEPAFLRDDVALERAKAAMQADGYDLRVWRPLADRRSKAPDGMEDVYLARNGINPNRGYVDFLNPTFQGLRNQRSVEIELKGDTVECRVIVPK